MKPLLFAANWKMNKGPKEARQFFLDFLPGLKAETFKNTCFFPPALCFEAAAEKLNPTKLRWGAQNCYSQASGAFTGEISAQVVKDLGGQMILLGHSERRQIFKESDEFIAEKARFVQSLGLTPMLCIGESLEERESGHTKAVVEKQLDAVCEKIDTNKPWIIAYEPVWAIGTGKVASLEQVAEVHTLIRWLLKNKYHVSDSENFLILYGGSVKADNAKYLIALKDVNGFLVGGASLEVKSFQAICACVE